MEGLIVALSGMSNVEQMKDNLKTMKDFKPMTEEEYKVVEKARETLNAVPHIPCTSCQYCVKGCPMQINIPGVFEAMNKVLIYNHEAAAKQSYGWNTSRGGKASECIQCGQCEAACPQHIDIIEQLKKAAEMFEA